jgi:hypothetical protein
MKSAISWAFFASQEAPGSIESEGIDSKASAMFQTPARLVCALSIDLRRVLEGIREGALWLVN